MSLSFSVPIDFPSEKQASLTYFWQICTFNREGKTYIICPIFVKIFCSRNQKKSLGNYPLQTRLKMLFRSKTAICMLFQHFVRHFNCLKAFVVDVQG